MSRWLAVLAIIPVLMLGLRAEAALDEAVAEVVASEHSQDAGHADKDHSGHGHSGGHGHEFDPTHMNLSDRAEDPSEWRSDMAIASLIIFSLLLAGLATVAWKPISEGLQKREKTIANNIANAERASQEAMAKLREYESRMAAASAEAQKMLADARKDAEVAGQRLVAEAQEEAARQRQRAVAEIDSAKSVALSELAEKSTDIAMSLAGRIIGREIRAEDHQSMIQEMLSKLPSNN